MTTSTPPLRVTLQGLETGMPVVLSHALGLDLGMWESFADALSPRFRVLRYDHRGHGGSASPPGPYAMDDLVDDAARVVREWGVGPVGWVGLSMGGMVGQGLAIRHPELVKGLVLANTTSKYPPEAMANWRKRIETVQAGGMASVVDMVLERYLHDGIRASQPALVARYRDMILRCDPKGYAASCDAVACVDWSDRLGSIRVPTLILAGALDLGAPPSMARVLNEAIPGSGLVVLDNASHLSVEELPAEFASLVGGFLDQLARD